MDVVEFIKACKRMCETIYCENCELTDCCRLINDLDDPEKLVSVVEVWAKEHPAKTRQSEFLEHYPNALISGNEFLSICPFVVDNSFACCNDAEDCYTCKEKYWLQEVE